MALIITPPLNTYEYQYGTDGIRLNAQSSALPLWDVTKVTGLADFPDIKSNVAEHDGRDGDTIYAEFMGHRIVVIDGTLYADPTTFDQTLETLIAKLPTDNVNRPLFFRHAGLPTRYVSGKVLSFKSDVEQIRRTGSAVFQLQIGCSDPVKYIDEGAPAWVSGTNFNLFNRGNATTGPEITINITSTGTASVSVQNISTARTLSFSKAVTNGDTLTIDLRQLGVKLNGSYSPSGITLTGTKWPKLIAGTTTWAITCNRGNGSILYRSGWK